MGSATTLDASINLLPSEEHHTQAHDAHAHDASCTSCPGHDTTHANVTMDTTFHESPRHSMPKDWAFRWMDNIGTHQNLSKLEGHILKNDIPNNFVFRILIKSMKDTDITRIELLHKHRDELANRSLDTIRSRVYHLLEPGASIVLGEQKLAAFKPNVGVSITKFNNEFKSLGRSLGIEEHRMVKIFAENITPAKFSLIAPSLKAGNMSLDKVMTIISEHSKDPLRECYISSDTRDNGSNRRRHNKDDDGGNPRKKPKVPCIHCGKTNHKSEDCYFKDRKKDDDDKDKNGRKDSKTSDRGKPFDRKSHKRATSRIHYVSTPASTREAFNSIKMMRSNASPVPAAKNAVLDTPTTPSVVGVEINTVHLEGELDSGATHSMISSTTLNKLPVDS
ncbi:hypothetical protein AKO1_000864, partial [Acrasis kona]